MSSRECGERRIRCPKGDPIFKRGDSRHGRAAAMTTVNQHVTRGNLILESSLAAEKNPRIGHRYGYHAK